MLFCADCQLPVISRKLRPRRFDAPLKDCLVWRLTIDQQLQERTLVLLLEGRLGHVAGSELTRTLAAAIDAGTKNIVVDLTKIDYVSGRALSTVGAAADRLRAGGGQLVLCGVTEAVRVTLLVAGWLDRFPVETTRERAIARLESAASLEDP